MEWFQRRASTQSTDEWGELRDSESGTMVNKRWFLMTGYFFHHYRVQGLPNEYPSSAT